MEGFKEAEKVMMNLPKATAKAAMRRLLKKAAQPIAEAGRANAPERLGGLKESYGVGTRLSKRQGRVSRRESDVEVFAGPNDPAAVQTEFGNDHQSAEPHLRPAWDAEKYNALDIISEGLMDEVSKTVARYAKRMRKKGRR